MARRDSSLRWGMRIIAVLALGIACGDNVHVATHDAAHAPDAAPDASPDAPIALARLAPCVANDDDTIEVFDPLQDGDGPPLRRFGRITGLAGPASVAVDAVHDELYAANLSGTITVYGRTWTGGVA